MIFEVSVVSTDCFEQNWVLMSTRPRPRPRFLGPRSSQDQNQKKLVSRPVSRWDQVCRPPSLTHWYGYNSLTMEALLSFVNTNFPILSFSSCCTHLDANSHSLRVGFQFPKLNAHRILLLPILYIYLQKNKIKQSLYWQCSQITEFLVIFFAKGLAENLR